MSFMDSLLGGLKLTEDDGYDDDGYLDNEDDLNEPAPARQSERKNDSAGDDAPARKPVNRPGAGRSKRLGNGMEVCVIKPTSVDDSREIADTLLSNRTVVLNMEGLDGISHRESSILHQALHMRSTVIYRRYHITYS